MRRRENTYSSLFPPTPSPALEGFGTGEASAILRVPIWRLQKFLDSPKYQLSPEGKLGEGRGSRRVFSREDLYRIALAVRLVQDGFAAAFVGSLVGQIDDYDFHESHDDEGKEIPAPGLLGLVRGTNGPRLKLFASNRPPKLGDKDSPYYLLNLDEVFAEVHEGIRKLRK